MNASVKKTILFLFIILSITALLLILENIFFDNRVTGDISKNLFVSINNIVGSISILLFLHIIMCCVILLVNSKKIPVLNFISGLSLLLFVLPPLFEFLKIDNFNGGFVGVEINNLIIKSGGFSYFVYISLVFLSFFIFLFPYRYLITNNLVFLFKKPEDKSRKRYNNVDNSEKYYYKYNDNLRQHSKINKNIPWLSKVVYENQNKRMEFPVFPNNNGDKPKKFILKNNEKEYDVYMEVDTFSGEVPNEVYKEINKNEKSYFERIKDNWPESWKKNSQEKNSNYNVIKQIEYKEIDQNSDDIIDVEYIDDNVLYLDYYGKNIINYPNDQEDEIECLESADEVDFDEIFEKNFQCDKDKLLNIKNYGENKEYLPDFEILQTTNKIDAKQFRAEEKEAAIILENTLLEFNIEARVVDIIHGPVVTLFKINPAAGVKLSKIEGLSTNLALRLAAQSIRIIAPIPGEKVVGIEIPNRTRELVNFKEIVNSSAFLDSKYNIPIGIGKDIYGNIIVLDLFRMPHILIAGATGAGKSVCVNSFICSILYSKSPDELKLIFIDPKIVELKPYNDIPHLLTPVITDPKKAMTALKYLLFEMERRYSLLDEMGVRDIVEYRYANKNKKTYLENLPFIVAFVDEFADLMSTSGKEAEILFSRLAAKARAVGILLVLATQRPSADVITGLIKANIPARIAFQVISLQDSRIILDQKGAEKLLGQGDMLYLSPMQPFPIRVQGAYLSKEEVDSIAEHWKSISQPEYIDIEEMISDFEAEDERDDDLFSGESKDPLFEQALEIVQQMNKASASYLQRRLNIGYNRAARIVEEMEEMGIVGPQRGAKPREFIGNISNYDR